MWVIESFAGQVLSTAIYGPGASAEEVDLSDTARSATTWDVGTMHARSFYGGVADTLTAGLTSTMRTWSGINSVDQSLGAYRWGTAVGAAAGVLLGGAGGVGSLGGVGSTLTRGMSGIQLLGSAVTGVEAFRNNDLRGMFSSLTGALLNGFGTAGFDPCKTSSAALRDLFHGANLVSMGDGALGLGEQMLRAKDGLDWLNIAASGYGLAKSVEGFLAACFAAGTPLRTPDGSKPIEDFRVGDWILSRDENDAAGPVLSQRVEEVFVRTGRVWVLTLDGRAIHTTGEHPFFAEGHGWKPLAELSVGDRLLGENGDWLTIEALEDTGRYETVYNIKVSEFHTYFVGCEDWGFSVWAHNANCAFNWGDEALEPFAHLRGKMERAAKANDPKLINEILTEMQQVALERSASRRWQTGENSLQNGMSKFYEILDHHNSSYAVEYQAGFKKIGEIKGVPIWKRTTETAEQLKSRGGSFNETLWPDVVVTDLRGTARPVMESGLLTPEMSLQMSGKTKIVAVSDISQKQVGAALTNTTKPLIFDKYGVPITRYNGGATPDMTDIRLLNGLALPFTP